MRRDLRRQDDAFVVTVGHEECTQETRRDTPRRRMHQRALALFVLEVHLTQGDIEGEVAQQYGEKKSANNIKKTRQSNCKAYHAGR